MFTKYDLISALAMEMVQQISQSEAEWGKYLSCAGRLYNHPFHEQLLIYAQKPDATTCEAIETWNEKMFCWVNKGAKGIALFNEESPFGKLKYVFDASDVHAAKRIGHIPKPWKLKTEYQENVLKHLEKMYGETDFKMEFESTLIELAGKIAKQQYQKFLPELSEAEEGSSLSIPDTVSLERKLCETLSSSVAYTLLSRCGADMQFWEQGIDFRYICQFNTMETLAVLGNATTEICKPLLKEIGKSIENQELTKFKEKHDIHTQSLIERQQVKKGKGELTDETGIRTERGLPLSKAETKRRSGNRADGAGKTTTGIFEEQPTGNLSGSAVVRKTKRTLPAATENQRTKITSGQNVQKIKQTHSVKEKISKFKEKEEILTGQPEKSPKKEMQER